MRQEWRTLRAFSYKNWKRRFDATAWWAGQDSNLQPDRYERPALTIELPARSTGVAVP